MMITSTTQHAGMTTQEVIRAARRRLMSAQGACSAGNPELLKASIDGLLKEIPVTRQTRERINRELGFTTAKAG